MFAFLDIESEISHPSNDDSDDDDDDDSINNFLQDDNDNNVYKQPEGKQSKNTSSITSISLTNASNSHPSFQKKIMRSNRLLE